jgi:HrpA-like RNA helicase/predicted RNA-binding protein with RPS1 domain
MGSEWRSTCKDCGRTFGYSDAWYRAAVRRGQTRPERCSKCLNTHSRERQTAGLSYFVVERTGKGCATDPAPGALGRIVHPNRTHELTTIPSEVEDYRPKFGIAEANVDELFQQLASHQVVVIVGPTGSGKSTYLPYRLIEPGEANAKLFTPRGPVVVTQPRIQATSEIPGFVAKLLGSSVGPGQDVGYRYHNANAADWRNRLIYMTDGTLLNWIKSGEIARLGLLMIDEAHERSLNIDLILALLKRELPRYPHLRLVIASATIDAETFQRYFASKPRRDGMPEHEFKQWLQDEVPILNFAGKRRIDPKTGKEIGYQTIYRQANLLPYDHKKDPKLQALRHCVASALADQMLEILRTGEGDILGFLPTTAMIYTAVTSLTRAVQADPSLVGRVDVYPLTAQLSEPERRAAIEVRPEHAKRRVVIATNVAETSLTIEGITHVVDSGLIVERHWDPSTLVEQFPVVLHSQAGCKQRWGRAGRVRDGFAYCLYSEEQLKRFPEYTEPEIARAPLEAIVLSAKAAGVDPFEVQWITLPKELELSRALTQLNRWGALDADGDLTEHGQELDGFALEPELANLLIAADQFACAVEMATLIPMLQNRTGTKLLRRAITWDAPTRLAARRLHRALKAGCADDLEYYLKLYAAWKGELGEEHGSDWARRHYVDGHVFAERIEKEREALLDHLSGHKKSNERRPINFDLLDRVRLVFARCLPDRIWRRDPATHELDPIAPESPYRRLTINAASVCHDRPPESLVCAAVQGRNNQGLDTAFVVRLDSAWVRENGDHPLLFGESTAQTTNEREHQLARELAQECALVDQFFPLGSRWECRVTSRDDDGDWVLALGEPVAPAPFISECERARLYLQPAAESDAAEVGRELALVGDEAKSDGDVEFLDDEAEPSVYEAAGDYYDSAADAGDAPSPHEPDRHGLLAHRRAIPRRPIAKLAPGAPLSTSDEFVVDVVGYEFPDGDRPIVFVRPSGKLSPFQEFIERYKEGDAVAVHVVEVAHDTEDTELNVLVVREPETGLEIALEPEEVSFAGRGWTLNWIPPGAEMLVRVEAIDRDRPVVHCSALPFVEQEQARLLAAASDLMFSAVVREVNLHTVWVQLADSDPKKGIILAGLASAPKDLGRPVHDYATSDQVVAQIKAVPEARVELAELPADLDPANLPVELHWDPHRRTLGWRGAMPDQVWQALRVGSVGPTFRRAVDELYFRSNQLQVVLTDAEHAKEFYQAYPVGSSVEVTVIRPGRHGALVEVRTDELTARYWVPANQLPGRPEGKPGQVAPRGKRITARVLEPDPQTQAPRLSLRPDLLAPYRQAAADAWFSGRVTGIANYGLFVELPGPVSGLAFVTEVLTEPGKHLESRFSVGQEVQVRILAVKDDGKLALSMRDLAIARPETAPPRASGPIRPASPGGGAMAPFPAHDDSLEDVVRCLVPGVEVIASVREPGVGAKAIVTDVPACVRQISAIVAALQDGSGTAENVQFLSWQCTTEHLPDIEALLHEACLRRKHGKPPYDPVIEMRVKPVQGSAEITVRTRADAAMLIGSGGANVRLLKRLLGLARITVNVAEETAPR